MFGEFTWSAVQKQEVWLLKVLESNWKYLIFYYPVPHVVCRTTFMKRGVWLLLIWKLTGSPPLMWWISIFLISWCKGIALLNNLMPFFCNRRKIERFFFQKRSLKWWKTGIYLKVGGGGSFFWNCVNRSIFIRFQNGRDQIVWKSNPLIEKIMKKYIYIYIRGAGAPKLSTYP